MKGIRACFSIFLFACALLAWLPATASQSKRPRTDITVTTRSARARAHFETGLDKYQTLHVEDALENWRKATREDPHFALAHILLSQFAEDPTEQVSERDKALATKKFAGKEEQVVIDWLSATSKGQWVPAIQAMNSALHDYGAHKEVVWLAANWLVAQQQWARSLPLYERLNAMDPNFADAWNSAAYSYAHTRQFDKAFAAMQRYTELLPGEPNPHDSFAEISRMAGKFDDALAHYRAALKIDPSFIVSQEGLADTYALMGEESRARTEYATAIAKATNVQAVTWGLQSAATYVREGNDALADLAFEDVAMQARSRGFGNLEAQAYRTMAMYQRDGAKARQLLDKALAVLDEEQQVSKVLLDQERAVVLRSRIYRAIQDGDLPAATATLKQLEDLSGSSADASVTANFDSASGAVLLARGEYLDAIMHLESDERNPYSLRNLIVAYDGNGAHDQAELAAQRLAGFNEPTIEQALVVPAFRRNHGAAPVETKPAGGAISSARRM
ncbi:MAG TPA: tetratricopeptide repeat protein [Verrucomicrobiae bacterium]|nr:tetratricopeptide repeat protein [Verrucomicrobiae bacterium]